MLRNVDIVSICKCYVVLAHVDYAPVIELCNHVMGDILLLYFTFVLFVHTCIKAIRVI